MLAAPPSPPLPPLLPRPRNPFGAASFPQASIPGEKRKLCFLLRSGENRASLSPGPGGTSLLLWGCDGLFVSPPSPHHHHHHLPRLPSLARGVVCSAACGIAAVCWLRPRGAS